MDKYLKEANDNLKMPSDTERNANKGKSNILNAPVPQPLPQGNQFKEYLLPKYEEELREEERKGSSFRKVSSELWPSHKSVGGNHKTAVSLASEIVKRSNQKKDEWKKNMELEALKNNPPFKFKARPVGVIHQPLSISYKKTINTPKQTTKTLN